MVDSLEPGKIIWFSGQYGKEIKEGYGGGERSLNVARILSTITGKELVFIALARAFGKNSSCIADDNIKCLKFSYFSILCRGLIKILCHPIGSRCALKLKCLCPRKESLSRLVKEINERDIVVFDGLKGFIMAKPIMDKLLKIRNLRKIYLSHNFEADYYKGLKTWIVEQEKKAAMNSDIILAASTRDATRYILDLNIEKEKIIVLPNIFPVSYKPKEKLARKTAAIIAGSSPHIANKIGEFLLQHELIEVLLYIGKIPPKKRHNTKAELIYIRYIKDRRELLEMLSQAHLGINFGLWLGGTNVKKYDYALAGLTIYSGGTGFRGEWLPGEIPYTDLYDLAAKISEHDIDKLLAWGSQNKKIAENIYESAVHKLRNKLRYNSI